MAEIPKRVGAK